MTPSSEKFPKRKAQSTKQARLPELFFSDHLGLSDPGTSSIHPPLGTSSIHSQSQNRNCSPVSLVLSENRSSTVPSVDSLFSSLNHEQKMAAEASPGILQIVAGPGTGKTKVLVSRVAHLLLRQRIPPQNIVVTTFTKKAAAELVERLRVLGPQVDVDKILVGTFHSICFRLVRRFGAKIGLPRVSVADEKDAVQLVAQALEKVDVSAYPDDETAPFKARSGIDSKKVRRHLSRLKASLSEMSRSPADGKRFISRVLSLYQELLTASHLIDFDDCLILALRLLRDHHILPHVEHTLVDEFQDCSAVQLELMYAFSQGRSVTVVGDPDQSIYAFRAAQSGTFGDMRRHYEELGCTYQVVRLTENYRSTAAILALSERVMRQQMGREEKTLRAQHTASILPGYACLDSAAQEARWIAHHISHLGQYEIFDRADFAVLVRTAYQTRAIETEFARAKIPYTIVKGRAFWERRDVVAVVDYLRAVASDFDRLALFRALNVPRRGFGPKSVAELVQLHEKHKCLAFETLKQVASGAIQSSLGQKAQAQLTGFVNFVEKARSCLSECYEANDLGRFFNYVYVQSGLEKELGPDSEGNILEVRSQLAQFVLEDEEVSGQMGEIETEKEELRIRGDTGDKNISIPKIKKAENNLDVSREHLRQFLELLSLFDTDLSQESSQKVSISTIHGAKGLEWPVVFVPGLSEGLLPASFAVDDSKPETINEERRCFYVAASRAKVLLFLSAYTEDLDGQWGRKPIEKPSRFLKDLEGLICSKLSWPQETIEILQTITSRPPTKVDYKKLEEKYQLCLQAYVRKGVDPTSVTTGFASANEFKRNGKAPAYIPVRPSKKHNPHPMALPIIAQSSELKKTSFDRRNYAPKFSSPACNSVSTSRQKMAPEISAASSASTSVKRAPTYIPTRTTTKRRLGTR